MTTIPSIFVYGTLKRGEWRAGRWPREPIDVVPASTVGLLYDLGPYPALVDGSDRVLGELWTFAVDDMSDTLRALDEIECYGQQDVDLYIRRVVVCSTVRGEPVDAYCYFLADPAAVCDSQRIAPAADGFGQWQSSDTA